MKKTITLLTVTLLAGAATWYAYDTPAAARSCNQRAERASELQRLYPEVRMIAMAGDTAAGRGSRRGP